MLIFKTKLFVCVCITINMTVVYIHSFTKHLSAYLNALNSYLGQINIYIDNKLYNFCIITNYRDNLISTFQL